MKLLFILLLVSSCSSVPLRERLIKSHRVDSYQIGIKCPNNSFYSFNDGLCHFKPIGVVIKAKPKAKFKKPVKVAKIDCVKVFNQCMAGE